MKVIVRCANNRVTKADMEREIERLFQENKDLRLSESHLRDEVNILRQQSEARRQVICERDQHIQELEESLEKNTRLRETSITKMAEIQTKLYEQMQEAIHAGAEINIELMEADATIDEQKKRIEWLEEEVARLTNERDTAVNENTALTFDVNDLRDALDVEKELRSRAEHEREEFREKAGKYLDERNAAWDANKRLSGNEETITHYQEIADRRKEQLDEAMRTITSLNDDIRELEDTIDGLNEDKRAYGEEIDRLRKVVTNLQSTRFTTDEFIRMIARELMPSTGNSFADSVDF
jgi:chromosome segregation ATPase